MEKQGQHPRSHLFTIRVWEEETGTNQTEWRGKIQLITNGEVRYFCEWTALAPLLVALLTEFNAEEKE